MAHLCGPVLNNFNGNDMLILLINFTKLLGWLGISLAACLTTGRNDQEVDEPTDQVVSLGRMGEWLQTRRFAGEEQVVAMVGVHPDIDSLNSGLIDVVDPVGGPSRPSRVDTQAVSWLRATLPGLRIVCVPLAARSDLKATAEAIEIALRSRPTTLFIRAHTSRKGPLDGHDSLTNAIVHCWEQECLAFTIVVSAEEGLPPAGVLPILLADPEPSRGDSDKPDAAPEVHEAPPFLRAGTLQDGPFAADGEGTILAAAAYTLAILASLPDDGHAEHLERTARIALTGAVHRMPAGGNTFLS